MQAFLVMFPLHLEYRAPFHLFEMCINSHSFNSLIPMSSGEGVINVSTVQSSGVGKQDMRKHD